MWRRTNKNSSMELPGILAYLWIAVLAFGFYQIVRSSYRQSLGTEEFAYACDSFGYLRMAKQIRHAYERGVWPEFRLESPQTRLLIDFMRQNNVAVPRWDEVVAPHAHHYMPQSGYVGVQYPPGTGLVLAMFPQGEAIYRLNRIVVVVFVVAGIVALGIAAWKHAWASIGLVVLALSLGLMVMGRLGALSFSMNAVLVPILLTCVFSLLALRFRTADRNRLALLCALLAGLSEVPAFCVAKSDWWLVSCSESRDLFSSLSSVVPSLVDEAPEALPRASALVSMREVDATVTSVAPEKLRAMLASVSSLTMLSDTEAPTAVPSPAASPLVVV